MRALDRGRNEGVMRRYYCALKLLVNRIAVLAAADRNYVHAFGLKYLVDSSTDLRTKDF